MLNIVVVRDLATSLVGIPATTNSLATRSRMTRTTTTVTRAKTATTTTTGTSTPATTIAAQTATTESSEAADKRGGDGELPVSAEVMAGRARPSM